MSQLLTRPEDAGISAASRSTFDRSGAQWTAPVAIGEGDVEGNTSSRREVIGTNPAKLRVRADDEWSRIVWGRIAQYSKLPENWDSYGALPLSVEAIRGLSSVMQRIYDSVNSPPQVSMLVDGGIVCEWSSTDYDLSLTCASNGGVTVEFENGLTGEKFIKPSEEVSDLGKRVWETSLA